MMINYSAKRGKYVTKNMFRNMFFVIFLWFICYILKNICIFAPENNT